MTLARAIPDTLVTTYLEMTQPPTESMETPPDGALILSMQTVDVPFYRFLYDTVGDGWAWRDRRLLSDAELARILDDPNVSVHVLYAGGIPAGYVELVKDGAHPAHSTEIAYLGLRPGFTGLGLGKYLLSFGIARAWEDGARRVWVHTCNNDAPSALPNYLKRGFRVYRVDEEPMPDRYRT
jgi:GNAT superfamily N-acetyltransferase